LCVTKPRITGVMTHNNSKNGPVSGASYLMVLERRRARTFCGQARRVLAGRRPRTFRPQEAPFATVKGTLLDKKVIKP
jgi:hypothetical protein